MSGSTVCVFADISESVSVMFSVSVWVFFGLSECVARVCRRKFVYVFTYVSISLGLSVFTDLSVREFK